MNIKIPLHAIAHGRAGDKGNTLSISIIPYKVEAYQYLLEQISEERVFDLFKHKGASGVKRYEIPKFPALNFVIENALEAGVNASLCIDSHGKTFSFLILSELDLVVPTICLPNKSLYFEKSFKNLLEKF